MMTDGKEFDTNVFFSGGAGMFLQYHDIIKPVYLCAIIKMIFMNQSFGLPLNIIQHMSILSLIEWYMKRRFINPLRCLDFNHQIDQEVMDDLMQKILMNDSSIYKLAPTLNIERMFDVYRSHHMTFPVYIYTEKEEPYVREDCKSIFSGINVSYVYGDLKNAISNCNQNFTYIFSDIELVKTAIETLHGTCSHILMASDYRYNFEDNYKTARYNLVDLTKAHPFVRTGLTQAVDNARLA
ncbi:MAG: hypothetical protein NC548_60355, partial [Lachnospiraceae bacterium]|nr:hypothetical protein [Lachnospiraceae bacterium]